MTRLEVARRYHRLGSGNGLRLLDRIGIPRADIAYLPAHFQPREVGRRVIAEGLTVQFEKAASEIEAES